MPATRGKRKARELVPSIMACESISRQVNLEVRGMHMLLRAIVRALEVIRGVVCVMQRTMYDVEEVERDD